MSPARLRAVGEGAGALGGARMRPQVMRKLMANTWGCSRARGEHVVWKQMDIDLRKLAGAV